jgi:predicted DNA repair protein MutK
VVIDDAAVTPRYVTGFTPDRELPIIWRIAKGSLFNKLAIILPVALLLNWLLPWAITPLLMLGGAIFATKARRRSGTR